MNAINFKELLNKALELKKNGFNLESAKQFAELSKYLPDGIQKNQILNQTAFLFQKSNDYKNAVFYYKEILNKGFSSVDIYNNYALSLQNLGNYNEALKYFFKALQLSPNNPSIFFNIASTLYLKNELISSLEYYKKAISIEPSNLHYLSNIAILYQELEEYKLAEEQYYKIISISENSDYLTDLGVCYYHQGNYENALNYFEKALEKNKDNSHAQWYKVFILYLLGKYKKGFEFIKEVKFLEKNFVDPYFNKPLWLGEIHSTKTLLLDCDGGLGDSIQFLRYINYLQSKFFKVTIACQKELLELLKSNLQCEVILKDDIKNNYDFYFSILASIHFFNFEDKSKPLEITNFNKIELNDLKSEKIKIGIVWESKKNTKTYLKRSINLDKLNFLFKLENVKIFSLQKDFDNNEIEKYPNIINLSKNINNMYDTAYFISQMDFIVTVDTSVAHLSGSMNKQTFLLLPFSPDWRWGIEQTKSDWYPSITIYRQTNLKNWKDCLNNLEIDLKKILQNSA